MIHDPQFLEGVASFEKKLNLKFNDQELLIQALTHSSFARHSRKTQIADNERLEFFGDAVLKLIVSEFLFFKYNDADEGVLTKIRARIISDKTLAGIADAIQLGDHLRFSYGEAQSGGAVKESNLANAMEAVLGACYLDVGYAPTKDLFVSWLASVPQDWQSPVYISDFKTYLQEWTQQQKIALPHYEIISEEGPDHNKIFNVEVSIDTDPSPFKSTGTGKTKKEAEQSAAKVAMRTLNLIPQTESDS
jgi:ribonuclease III